MEPSIDQSVGATVTIPDWLTPLPTKTPPRTLEQQKVQTELVQTQFESMFIRVLEEIASGRTINEILSNDFRGFKSGAFMRWVDRDPERTSLMDTAKRLRTEHWAGEMIEISNSQDTIVDANWARVKIDTRWKLMGADNRKRYGDVKTIDVGGSISILKAQTDAAELRLVELSDVTDVTPRLENS